MAGFQVSSSATLFAFAVVLATLSQSHTAYGFSGFAGRGSMLHSFGGWGGNPWSGFGGGAFGGDGDQDDGDFGGFGGMMSQGGGMQGGGMQGGMQGGGMQGGMQGGGMPTGGFGGGAGTPLANVLRGGLNAFMDMADIDDDHMSGALNFFRSALTNLRSRIMQFNQQQLSSGGQAQPTWPSAPSGPNALPDNGGSLGTSGGQGQGGAGGRLGASFEVDDDFRPAGGFALKQYLCDQEGGVCVRQCENQSDTITSVDCGPGLVCCDM